MLDVSRRKRIAYGSGTSDEQGNRLVEGRNQMAKIMKAMGSGKMPALQNLQQGGASGTMPGPPSGKPRPSATRKSGSKRKKKSRR